jgi:3-oxoacyl-[acyl-carrier-protein] synthase II
VTHRVVITGMGVVSAIGRSVDAFRDALFAGRSGIGPITIFDPATLPTRIAAEVKWDGEIMRDRKVTFAIAAAAQAMADTTRTGTRPVGEGGLSLGLGLELFSMDDLAARRNGQPLPVDARERLLYLQTPSDLCVALLGQRFDLHAPPLTHVSACAAGTDAIGSAFRMIASGRRRWMMAGGADSMINPLGVAGFCSIGATSTANDDPPRASRPFDARRSGFVLGEGAGMLILERLEDARGRGAPLQAEICGYGASFDAHGISEPHPEGRGAFQAMSRALH